MERNALLSLNNLIYQIYNTDDFDNMRKSVLLLMKTVIPNTCASILMVDKSEVDLKFSNPVCMPQEFQEMEESYSKVEKYDYSNWMLMSSQAKVINGSFLMPEEERIQTELYNKWLKPYGLHYLLDMTIVYNGHMLGVLSLYRAKEDGDFTDEEINVLRAIGDHLNVRFYKNSIEQNENINRHVEEKNPKNARQLAAEYNLTQREYEVLSHILDGLTNDEICDAMCITSNTLKKHLQNLYRKLGVSSRMKLLNLTV